MRGLQAYQPVCSGVVCDTTKYGKEADGMKKVWICLAALFSALAAVGLACNKLKELPKIRNDEGHAVAVIGGADGPTAIVVAGHSRSSLWRTVLVHACMALSRFAQFRVRHSRRRAR